ncbi:hypothetical protein JOB18_006454 [Solea senegalensis]|uniref:Uncharacterized protein n=1 Tax=Solea senegalensis TaxID=28829 RepID=A0AAV6RGJ2_SOLSE|nr:hypothetical protein JOB18_006454 [Solea senegalensis]
MRQLRCICPTTTDLEGHSQEGGIHHSDTWMLRGEDSERISAEGSDEGAAVVMETRGEGVTWQGEAPPPPPPVTTDSTVSSSCSGQLLQNGCRGFAADEPLLNASCCE